jgi:hypothetical protein
MKSCKPYQEIINNMDYIDLSDDEHDQFMAHINDCSQCNMKFEEMKNLLLQMDEKVRPEPLPGFEERLWNNINSVINPNEKNSLISKIRHKISEYYYNRYLRYSLAFAVTMLILGIFIGKYIIPADSKHPQPAQIDSANRASFVRAERYIDRSKVLLLGILNHDPEDQMGLQHQRQISREMIKEAAVLKNELKDPESQLMSHLIGELEVILMQIASLEAEYDLESVQLIQNGIERKGLLFKIDINQVITDTQKEVKKNENNKMGI